jgi:hypothetical protein
MRNDFLDLFCQVSQLGSRYPGASLHARRRIILEQLHQHPLQSNPVELRAGPVFVVDAVSDCQRVYVFASLQIREFKAKFEKLSIVPVSQAFHPIFDGLDDGGSHQLAQPIEELRVRLFPGGALDRNN